MNCLDSSFIIDFLNPERQHHESSRRWMEEHAEEPHLVPYICVFEVLRGSPQQDEETYRRARSFFDGRAVQVIESGFTEAAAAAELDARLHGEGNPLSARDTLVAAAAHRTGSRLVTRDRDFEDTPVDVDFYV